MVFVSKRAIAPVQEISLASDSLLLIGIPEASRTAYGHDGRARIFVPTVEPAPRSFWCIASSQYPQTGRPGFTVGDHTLLYYDVTHRLRGVFIYYPQGLYRKSGCVSMQLEAPGNFCVLVDPYCQRQGIGTSLVLEAIARWNVRYDKQVYTPAGARLAACVDVAVRSKSTGPNDWPSDNKRNTNGANHEQA